MATASFLESLSFRIVIMDKSSRSLAHISHIYFCIAATAQDTIHVCVQWICVSSVIPSPRLIQWKVCIGTNNIKHTRKYAPGIRQHNALSVAIQLAHQQNKSEQYLSTTGFLALALKFHHGNVTKRACMYTRIANRPTSTSQEQCAVATLLAQAWKAFNR